MTVIGAYLCGREYASVGFGMPIQKFESQAYEGTGNRPLKDEHVHRLDQVAGTTLLADYMLQCTMERWCRRVSRRAWTTWSCTADHLRPRPTEARLIRSCLPSLTMRSSRDLKSTRSSPPCSPTCPPATPRCSRAFSSSAKEVSSEYL